MYFAAFAPLAGAAGAFWPTLLGASGEALLRPLLVQLIVIILAARLGAVVARRLGQPSVVGEIVAGLLLAIGTTLMATPLAARMLRGSHYEPLLVERGFLR
jgi:hypothetical protein